MSGYRVSIRCTLHTFSRVPKAYERMAESLRALFARLQDWDTDQCLSECPKNDTLEGGEAAFRRWTGCRYEEAGTRFAEMSDASAFSHSLIPRYRI
jgi:hypothetical protein